MKNLKKVLALVVALTMVLGTVAFASFTDVTAEADSFTAVQTLSSLEILNGYEDGTFKPEGDITRAEFCAVVCRALGLEGSANGAKGATQFTDVAADHWASGYINLAAGQKIVNGMGDGTFAPESNVTFEQAVKMLVVALGYEPMAAQKGGYPTGYLVVANTYGMTEGVKASDQTAAASRGIVAQLTYNALDIPVMRQVGFGTNVEYQIMDGNNDYDYESLLTNLGVAKLEGVVDGTAVIGGKVEVGQVEYSFNEANDDPDWTKYLDKNADDKTGFANYTFYVAEGIDADSFFGVASIVYVREMSKNKYEIIAIMPNDDSETVVLGKEDLDLDETDEDAIVYFPTKDSKKTDKIRLADSIKLYINYEAETKDDFKTAVNKLTGDVEITVVENTGDSKFDMIVIKNYAYALVDEVEVEKDRFTTAGADGKTYTFDFEDEEISNKLVNAEGEAITLADFAENDVVAILSEDNKKKDFTWIEIVNLGQNAVEGTVTEVDDEEIYIDGTSYEVSGEMPKLGDEGAFFLTATGKVFYFDLSASVSGNYGYILETALNDSGFSEVWQVKLLTKDAGVVVYDVDDNFKVGKFNNKGELVKTAAKGDDANVAILSALENKNDHKADAAARLVTYKLNASNYIKEINEVDSEVVKADSEYNADAQSIDKKALEDDTVIFNVSNSSVNSAYKADIATLVDEAKYSGIVAKNDDGEFDCFVVLVGGSKIDAASDIAVVESVTNITTEDDEEAIKVRYYISNEDEVKELVIVNDTEISEGYWGSDIEDVKKGSLIMFTADEAGVASAFTVLANVAADNTWTENKEALKALVSEDEDNEFVISAIFDYESKTAGRIITYTEGGDTLAIKASTNKYTVDNTRRTWAIDVSDWEGGDVDKADGKNYTWFFARVYNDVVADFITIGEQSKVVPVVEEDNKEDEKVDSDAGVDSGAGSDAGVDSGAGSDAGSDAE